ncbi:MAG: outer membrane protein assembly factor BamD, partial [Cyclobacteriaceae bacterium]
ETMYDYAKASISDRQEERFQLCIDRYQNFIEKYPSSEYLKEAEQYFVKSREELAKFADRNQKDT